MIMRLLILITTLSVSLSAHAFTSVVDETKTLTSTQQDEIAKLSYSFPTKLIVADLRSTLALGELAEARSDYAVVIAWSPAARLVSVRAGDKLNIDSSQWDQIAAAGNVHFRAQDYTAAVSDIFSAAQAARGAYINWSTVFLVLLLVIVAVLVAWLLASGGGGGGGVYTSVGYYDSSSSDSGSSGGDSSY